MSLDCTQREVRGHWGLSRLRLTDAVTISQGHLLAMWKRVQTESRLNTEGEDQRDSSSLCDYSLDLLHFFFFFSKEYLLYLKSERQAKKKKRSSHLGAALTNLTRNHEVSGSISGLTQWVKDLALP